MLARWCSNASSRPYTTLVGGGGKECIFWGSNFSVGKCSLKEILLQADFLWLVPGRQQQHPGPPLKVKCLGMTCPYLATPLENFLGISSGGEILASQPGSSSFLYRWLPSGRLSPPITARYLFPSLWACLEISLPHPLQKKLSTHLHGLCDTAEVSGLHKNGRSTTEWVPLAQLVHLERVLSFRLQKPQHRSGEKTLKGKWKMEGKKEEEPVGCSGPLGNGHAGLWHVLWWEWQFHV